jgi:predicted permease
MNTLIAIGAKIVLAGALGYFLRKRGLISHEVAQGVGFLLMSVVTPFAILGAAGRKFSPTLAESLATTACIALVYYPLFIILMKLVAKVLRIDDAERRAFVNLTVFPNVTFIGIPIVAQMFGPDGLLCSVVGNLIFNGLFFSFGMNNMDRHSRFSMKKFFSSPLVLACIAAMILFFLPWRIPGAMQGAIEMMGACMAPLAMMIIGFGLADSSLAGLVRNPLGYLVSLLRLVVLPLAILTASKLLGIDHLAGAVSTIMFAMPCATMTVVLAAQFKTGYQFAAQSAVQSNVFMFATLPAVFFLVNNWL